jgi:pSer/pThr/pTyr-binding forkhead associated (FHA) protein
MGTAPAADGQHPARLAHRAADGVVVAFDLPPEVEELTIGRSSRNAVALRWDSEVSRLHAVLRCAGGEWTINDDGLSSNGTFVNGRRLRGRRRLRDGDVITVGRTALAFGLAAARAPSLTVTKPPADALAAPVHLTPTDRRLLEVLAAPLRETGTAVPATNEEIARALGVTVASVKARLHSLFQRYGLDQLPQNEKRARLAVVALDDHAPPELPTAPQLPAVSSPHP